MIQRRDIATVILLSIVTCGIYSIVFWYQFTKDINIMCAGDGEETQDYIIVWLLGIVTCGIYPLYWFYKLGDRMQRNAPRYGLQFQENGSTILLWMVLGYVTVGAIAFYAWYLIIKNMNFMADRYNQGLQNAGQNVPPPQAGAPTQF